MKQTLGSGEDLDKGPKIHNPFYLSKIYLAEFCFCSNTGYYIHSLFCRFPIRRGYVDKSAVVYIYLYPCLFYDSPDNLPARAYDVSNLILFNLHGVNSRGIRSKVFLKTEDISKNNNLVSFFHQTHCNASNMGLDRDTCIHQSKGTTAYRCHGR